MNLKETKYSRFALVKEMLDTPVLIKDFRTGDLTRVMDFFKKTGKLFLTGEGSSRIFPAKHCVFQGFKKNNPLRIHTEGSRQAMEFDLRDYALFGASNSGKTKEIIELFRKKRAGGQFALTAHRDTPLGECSDQVFILNCGPEQAVAATKSVIEQALFYHCLLSVFTGRAFDRDVLADFSQKAREVLESPIDSRAVKALAQAPLIYFAGRNDGVAEEAALKTNEIVRKKSDFLEGTYAVHGIEEVMRSNEVVILIEPYNEEEEKFRKVLVEEVGLQVFAVSRRSTSFPTLHIPACDGFDAYLQLMACWNILVEVALELEINLDKPERARKVGNEYRAG